jgi:hypothetical protein
MDDEDLGPYFSVFEPKPLSDFGPNMVKSVEDLRSLAHAAKEVLVSLRLRDVNATNILMFVDMMVERERSMQ